MKTTSVEAFPLDAYLLTCYNGIEKAILNLGVPIDSNITRKPDYRAVRRRDSRNQRQSGWSR
jgi:hypothetical protein